MTADKLKPKTRHDEALRVVFIILLLEISDPRSNHRAHQVRWKQVHAWFLQHDVLDCGRLRFFGGRSEYSFLVADE